MNADDVLLGGQKVPCLLWEVTEPMFRTRQLGVRGTKDISSFNEADLQLMEKDRLLYSMQLNV